MKDKPTTEAIKQLVREIVGEHPDGIDKDELVEEVLRRFRMRKQRTH